MSAMTLEELKAAMPKGLAGFASQEFLDKVNGIATDPDAAEVIKENFVSYTKVLLDGKFKTEDYLCAVAYVSYKLMGYTNQDAYAKTFPDRMHRHALLGTSSKDISAYVSAYNKNKLVNLITEQSLIPTWVLNADVYQKAINVQLELMVGATSEKVRSDAANSILTHLKPPEIKKIELDIGVKNEGGIGDLKATMAALAERQLELIRAGMPAKAIAHTPMTLEGTVIKATTRDLDVIDVEVISPVPAPKAEHKQELVSPTPVLGPMAPGRLVPADPVIPSGTPSLFGQAVQRHKPPADPPRNPAPPLSLEQSDLSPGATTAQPAASAEGVGREATSLPPVDAPTVSTDDGDYNPSGERLTLWGGQAA